MKKLYSSNIPRAQETAEIVGKEINIDKISSRDILKECPQKLMEAFNKIKITGISEEEFLHDFLEGKLDIKPNEVAKPYIATLKQIFDRVHRQEGNDTVKLITFRHGHKTKSGDLSSIGKKGAQRLGKKLSKQEETAKNTLYFAMHNTINEAIAASLFSKKELPKKWKEGLGFLETVTYTFKKGHIEIERGGEKRKLSYDKFNEIVKSL